MDQLVKALDLKREIEMTAADYYAAEKGLNERYLREIVQSATRVNYGQDLDELHALGSHVSVVLLDAVLIPWDEPTGAILLITLFLSSIFAKTPSL